MAKRSNPAIEQTQWGWQYVLPGAERIKPAVTRPPDYSVEGQQFVLPGAEKISIREFLQRKLRAPIRPRCGQKSIHGTALLNKQT